MNPNQTKKQMEENEVIPKVAPQVQETILPTTIADGNNDSGELLKNPFQRSSRLAYSPPGTERTRSASPCMQHFGFMKAMTAEEIYRAIGDKVKELAEMMELPKRNINQPMRDLVTNITDLHKKLEGSILTPKNLALRGAHGVPKRGNGVKDGCTQTSPLIKRIESTPKRAIDNAGTRKSPAKRNKNNRVEALRNTPVKMTEHVATDKWETVKSKKTRKDLTQNTPKSDEKAERNNTRRNQRRQRPPRKDAIVVKSVGSISYAEILKRVKSDPNLKELNNDVQGVKKTAKGELLLVLAKPSDPNTLKIHEAVKVALGEAVEVKALTELRHVEIRDLDEITTKEEIHEVIRKQFKELDVPASAILGLRKAYGGTQTATLRVTPETATKLLEANKIRIGLVICRIREKIEPKRCFKCMEYGHVAGSCKSPADYTSVCFKCGNKDHQAKNCTQAASCIICRKKNVSDAGHAMTSSKCPEYQRALKEIRRK